ncbi:MAG: HIT domain-containing protein [Phreatobacter sp.]|uniref:HIT family protein n=1 Tax=Phreatobacter sp. TaxID=1966341 RepID=UPI001A503FAD|nr:HIT family protein [Phreatobacter sp.]MBL8570542.1 HIT domain-containing protein [Phreatobacter sp.]
MPAPFADLDPRLAADSVPVADLALCQVRLMNDATYPWVLLVPRREGAVEIVDLAPEDRATLMDEIALVSGVLRAMTRCDKLNVAALGNMVPQLHVHVIARFAGDPAWPGPVWGKAPAQPYAAASRDGLVSALAARLSPARPPAG